MRAVVVRSKRRIPYNLWIPVMFLTILLSCLSLAHAVVMTDGYYKSCNQYRKKLIQLLDSTGREAEVENIASTKIPKIPVYFQFAGIVYTIIVFFLSFYRLCTIGFLAEQSSISWIIYRRM